MAAPGSITPPRRNAGSRPVRRFTLDMANKSLPLVKRIVADIVAAHTKVCGLRQTLEHATAAKEHQAGQRDLDAQVARLEELVDELSNVGVELKDYETGLVDFVGRHDGRDVYLCWKLGEDRIGYWHELNAGFAGRKPVSQLKERAEKQEKA
jgi:hypothetical protein